MLQVNKIRLSVKSTKNPAIAVFYQSYYILLTQILLSADLSRIAERRFAFMRTNLAKKEVPLWKLSLKKIIIYLLLNL